MRTLRLLRSPRVRRAQLGGLWLPLLSSVFVSASCASSQQQPAQSAPQTPSAPAPPVETPTPPTEASTPSSPQPPPELDRLARSVRALEDRARDADHHRVTRALRDAAAALDSLDPEVAGGGDALRTAADRIESSGEDSLSHADEVRAALVAARDRLQAHDPGVAPSEAWRVALDELAQAVDSLSAHRPLLEQKRAVSTGFRALSDALFVTEGLEPPFAGRAPEPRQAAEALEQARADILSLGQADLSNIRERASRAMHSMADLAQVLAGPGHAAGQVTDMRAQAERLESDSSWPFARTGWVDRGLQGALDALDEVKVCSEGLVAGWTEAARRAASALPERGSLPFQRAAVQDAFRATLDAFGMVLVARATCAPSSTPSATVTAGSAGEQPLGR